MEAKEQNEVIERLARIETMLKYQNGAIKEEVKRNNNQDNELKNIGNRLGGHRAYFIILGAVSLTILGFFLNSML